MSNLSIEILSDLTSVDDSVWNNIVNQSKTGARKDLIGYAGARQEGNPGEPFTILVRKKSNPVGLIWGNIRDLPLGKKFLSTRTPVVISKEEDVLERLFNGLEHYCQSRNIVYHEMRTSKLEDARLVGFLKELGYSSEMFSCQHKLDIDRELESILKDMSNDRRKNFHDARQRGEIEKIDPSREELLNFYNDTIEFQRRPQVPVLGADYFVALSDIDDIKIMKFHADGDIKAQNLYLEDSKNSNVDYLLSGVHESYREYNALEALHAAAIYSYHGEYETYNFGDNKADFRNGIFRFKQQYGSHIEPLMKWKRVFPGAANKAYMEALKRMRGEGF